MKKLTSKGTMGKWSAPKSFVNGKITDYKESKGKYKFDTKKDSGVVTPQRFMKK